MAIGRNSDGDWLDSVATAQRVITVDASGTPTSGGAPVTRTKVIARYNNSGVGGATAPGTRTITTGARSYTVVVLAASSATSPTFDGVALPAGMTVSYSADGANTLPAASLVTAAGDDVVYEEVR